MFEDIEKLKKELNICSLFFDMWNMGNYIDLRGLPDIREIAYKIKEDFMVLPKEYRNIALFNEQFYNTYKENKKYMVEEIDYIFQRFNFQRELTAKILNTIDEDGKIVDKATPNLYEIRKKLEKIKSKISNVISTLVNRNMKYLAIEQPVLRNERMCLAVKQENRKNVQGFLVGKSDSGSTYYIEPEQISNLNEEYALLLDEEKAEVARILSQIDFELKNKSNIIESNIEVVSYIDAITAKIVYKTKNNFDFVIPSINNSEIYLDGLKHPLIPEDQIVPLRIKMSKKALIITGPNTGGKTVSLKSLGIAFFLSHSAFPVPAYTARLPFIKNIYTDIGDEQSISQNLSTFSSHLRNLKSIIDESRENDLIIIDELGTGTDPVEGAALGKAIIERLLEKNTYLFVTSHLSEIKTYSLEDERLSSASMSFDLETLMPTYKFFMGVPGASHAIEIAQRMGFEEKLIENARNNIDEDFIKSERIFSELTKSYEEMEKDKEYQKREKFKLEKLRKEYEDKFEKVKNKELEKVDKELKQLKAEMKLIKKDLEVSLQKIKEAEKDSNKEILREEMKKIQSLSEKSNDLKLGNSQKKKKFHEIKEGMEVLIPGGSIGIISKLNGEKAVIKLKNNPIEFTFEKDELTPVKKEKKAEKNFNLSVKPSKKMNIEIDVRGYTVSEAIPEVENLISEIISNNYDFGYIIHGKGTGKLAEGIWDYLRKTKNIKSFRIGKTGEGGTGVTVVEV